MSLNFFIELIFFGYVILLSTSDYFVIFFPVLKYFNFISCLITWGRTSEIRLHAYYGSGNEFYIRNFILKREKKRLSPHVISISFSY